MSLIRNVNKQRETTNYPIHYPIKYLSPSSLKEWQLCPHKFYLKRMSEFKNRLKEKTKYEQGLPAAVGTALDAFVKDHLSNNVFMDGKFDLNYNLAKQITYKGKAPMSQVIDAGKALFEVYRETGALDMALDDGLCEVELESVIPMGNAMVMSKLDAKTNQEIPFDWKVRGYASSPKSPTPGWTRCWKKGKLLPKAHKRSEDYFELINRDWAQQLTIYGFSLGHQPGDPLYVFFDEFSMRQNVNVPVVNIDTVVVTQIRSRVSADFQKRVFADLQLAWGETQTGRFPKPEANKERCYPYRQECPASEFCKSFMSSFGDPKFRKIMRLKV